jgi:hypothetical protein
MKLRGLLSLLSVATCGLVLLFSSALRADATDPRLDEANRAYEAGRYDEASVLFGQLITDRGYSAPLCFDLANAEFKSGHVGLALLNYERARYLAPGDTEINRTLQFARKQAGLEPDPFRWWQIVLLSIDWTVWMGVVIAALALVLLAMIGTACADAWAAAFKVAPRSLRRFFKSVIFICVPVFLFFGFVELSTIGFNDRIEGVIISKQAPLRLSPFESAEQTGTLPEGELVTIEQQHDDYFWVDQRSHQSGWVQEKAIEPVLPGSLAAAATR